MCICVFSFASFRLLFFLLAIPTQGVDCLCVLLAAYSPFTTFCVCVCVFLYFIFLTDCAIFFFSLCICERVRDTQHNLNLLCVLSVCAFNDKWWWRVIRRTAPIELAHHCSSVVVVAVVVCTTFVYVRPDVLIA